MVFGKKGGWGKQDMDASVSAFVILLPMDRTRDMSQFHETAKKSTECGIGHKFTFLII